MTRKILLQILALLVIGYTSNAQTQLSEVLKFSQSVVTYNEITDGETIFTSGIDDTSFPSASGDGYDLGFTFQYNGNNFDRFIINNNGWIALGSSSLEPHTIINGSTWSSPLTNSSNIDIRYNRIGAYTRDLFGQTGSEIKYKTELNNGLKVLIVQFKNYRRISQYGDNLNFQIRLYEKTNIIEFVYGTMVVSSDTNDGEVGLKAESNNNLLLLKTTTDWSLPIISTTTGNCVLSPSIYPINGLKYTFSPIDYSNDVGISSIILPQQVTSDKENIVKVKLENFGNNTILKATIDWSIDGVSQIPYDWEGILNKSQSDEVVLGKTNFNPGNHNISATASFVNIVDESLSNNSKSISIHALSAVSGVSAFGFESNVTDSIYYLTDGFTNISIVNGIGNPGKALRFIGNSNFANSTSSAFIAIDATNRNDENVLLSFDLMQGRYEYSDLIVLADGKEIFSSYNSTSGYRKVEININDFKGKKFILEFKARCRYSNPNDYIYIDNISIYPVQVIATPELQSASYLEGTLHYNVNTLIDWDVTTNKSWLNVAKNGNQIDVNFSSNTDNEYRIADINIKRVGADGALKVVRLIQYGSKETISTDWENNNYSSSQSKSNALLIYSNTSWTIKSDQSWCKISSGYNSGVDNNSIYFNLDQNSSYYSRKAKLTIIGKDGVEKTVIVSQNAGRDLPYIRVVTPNFNVGPNSNVIPVDIETNAKIIDAVSNASWCQVGDNSSVKVPTKSMPVMIASIGGKNISILISANNTAYARTAIVLLTATDAESVSIMIKQDAGATEIEHNNDTELSIFPNPVSEKAIINLKQADSFNANIDLYNSEGKLVLSKSNVALKGYELNVQGWSKGIYNVMIRSNNKTYNTKLSVQ